MSLPTATLREAAVPIVVISIAGVVMYPEVQTLIRGDPLGSGITDIVVGVLTLLLYAGLELINWTSDTSGTVTRTERLSVLVLLTAVIGVNAVLIYAVPGSLEAIGMIVVCIVGALVVLFEPDGKRSSSR